MPQPKTAHGPWREALQYWMKEKGVSQADIVRVTKIQPKTVSRIVRGFHTQTRLLERIATEVFELPLDAVLVSPERRLANEERRRLTAEITEMVLRAMETRIGTVHPSEPPKAPTTPAGKKAGTKVG